MSRTDRVHRILHLAASSDANAAEIERRDTERRCRSQGAYIDLLLQNGPLREGLSRAAAADTYATLASPTTFAFLTGDRGWDPGRFESWLADSLERLLLP